MVDEPCRFGNNHPAYVVSDDMKVLKELLGTLHNTGAFQDQQCPISSSLIKETYRKTFADLTNLLMTTPYSMIAFRRTEKVYIEVQYVNAKSLIVRHFLARINFSRSLEKSVYSWLAENRICQCKLIGLLYIKDSELCIFNVRFEKCLLYWSTSYSLKNVLTLGFMKLTNKAKGQLRSFQKHWAECKTTANSMDILQKLWTTSNQSLDEAETAIKLLINYTDDDLHCNLSKTSMKDKKEVTIYLKFLLLFVEIFTLFNQINCLPEAMFEKDVIFEKLKTTRRILYQKILPKDYDVQVIISCICFYVTVYDELQKQFKICDTTFDPSILDPTIATNKTNRPESLKTLRTLLSPLEIVNEQELIVEWKLLPYVLQAEDNNSTTKDMVEFWKYVFNSTSSFLPNTMNLVKAAMSLPFPNHDCISMSDALGGVDELQLQLAWLKNYAEANR